VHLVGYFRSCITMHAFMNIKRQVALSGLSVHPHGTTRLPLDEFL